MISPVEIEKKIEDCEYYINEYKHVDPIRCVDDPGGTRFQRNAIVPEKFINIDPKNNNFLR